MLFCSSAAHGESRLPLAAKIHRNELRLCGLRSQIQTTHLTPVLFASTVMAWRRSSKAPTVLLHPFSCHKSKSSCQSRASYFNPLPFPSLSPSPQSPPSTSAAHPLPPASPSQASSAAGAGSRNPHHCSASPASLLRPPRRSPKTLPPPSSPPRFPLLSLLSLYH